MSYGKTICYLISDVAALRRGPEEPINLLITEKVSTASLTSGLDWLVENGHNNSIENEDRGCQVKG